MAYTKEEYQNWPYVEKPVKFPNGRASTRALFRETITPPSKETHGYGFTRFTLKEEEQEGFPSAYQIILYAKSEYDAAMKITGSLGIWDRCRASTIVENGLSGGWWGIAVALEHQARRIEAEQMALLEEQAQKGSVTAMKELRALNKRSRERVNPLKKKEKNVSPINGIWEDIQDKKQG